MLSSCVELILPIISSLVFTISWLGSSSFVSGSGKFLPSEAFLSQMLSVSVPRVGPGFCRRGPALFLGRRSYEATNVALVFLCCGIYVFQMNVCFCCVRFSFFSTSQESVWEELLQNDLHCVEWGVKP